MEFADRYASLLQPLRINEAPPLQIARKLSLLEVQTRWFAGDFGLEFTGNGGTKVRIVNFGQWNSAPGADFRNALISFNGKEPQCGGVTFSEGAADPAPESGSAAAAILKVLTPEQMRPALAPIVEEVPTIVLDPAQIGFGAAEIPASHTCSAPLAGLPGERLERFLEAAAQFRLRRKAQRLLRLAEIHGSDESLYQALAETLGYKNNKLPFTVLAQRFPLTLLRSRRREIEPLLFAGSGFLSSTDLSQLEGDTRSYLREIWMQWWPSRTEFERLVISPKLWKLQGMRPVNHPQRRVAALAEIVRNWPVLQTLVRICNVPAIQNFFAQLQNSYWDFHYTLVSKRATTRMALVGENRVSAMLANVFFPAGIVSNPGLWKEYRELPALDSSQRVDVAALRLLGSSPAWRKLSKKIAFQQGVLQIYEDFCGREDGDCMRCELARQIERWSA